MNIDEALGRIYTAVSIMRYCAKDAPGGLDDILLDQCDRLEQVINDLEEQDEAAKLQCRSEEME